jgi:hypothetical protein
MEVVSPLPGPPGLLYVPIFWEEILQKRKISVVFAQNYSLISCSSSPKIMKPARHKNGKIIIQAVTEIL